MVLHSKVYISQGSRKGIFIVLARGQVERLDQLAKATGQTRSDLIREAITVFLNRTEKRIEESHVSYTVG